MTNNINTIIAGEISIKSAKTGSTDLSDSQTFTRLVDCLLSCVAQDTINFSVKLGQPETLCPQEALSNWVLSETQHVKFERSITLFNDLAIKLQSTIDESRNR